jgi:uncharacterized protein YciW
VIADPRAVAASWPDERLRAIAELAVAVTEAPWAMTRANLKRAHQAGLTDDDVLHVLALSAYFGHLNRIADAVAVPLDYEVRHRPPATDPSAPGLATAPRPLVGRPAIEVSRRPATATAIAEWRDYAFKRDLPLTRRQRHVIARWVALWLGDGGISAPDDLTINPLDDALRVLAEQLTLAPWKLDDTSFATLRAAGYDDAALFDACATASVAGLLSRLNVALVALAI